MVTLKKILEALGQSYTCSGYYPYGPWGMLFRPPRSPYPKDRH